MCLAIPGKLRERFEQNGLPMGKVDFTGSVVTACLAYVPEAAVGNYLIIHAGFALSIVDEAEAAETLRVWQEFQAQQQDEPQA